VVRMTRCAFEHSRGKLLFPETGQNLRFDRW
jgi:hypothetical protein